MMKLLIASAAVLVLGTAKSAMAGTSSLDQVNEYLVGGDNLSQCLNTNADLRSEDLAHADKIGARIHHHDYDGKEITPKQWISCDLPLAGLEVVGKEFKHCRRPTESLLRAEAEADGRFGSITALKSVCVAFVVLAVGRGGSRDYDSTPKENTP